MPDTSADATLNLGLPLLAAGQAQKHVTHNAALGLLDALVQLACLDKDLAAPPAAPREGDRYLVATPHPGGAWAALSNQIACFQDGVWTGLAPRAGWLAYVADEGEFYLFARGAWIPLRLTLKALENLGRLGVNATPDSANRLAVKSEAALFSWDDVTPGTGNLSVSLNKGATANSVGLAFQTGYGTRAQFGLLGSDSVTLKVSADGATFLPAFSVRPADGWMSVGAMLDPRAPIHVRTISGGAYNPSLFLEAYGDATDPVVGIRTAIARGLPDAPLPIKAGDRFFGFFGQGWPGGGAYSPNAVAFNGAAEEDFVPGAYGTFMDFQTTGLGSARRRSVVKFRANGALELVPQAADPVAGNALGQLCTNSTDTALKWHDGTAWRRVTNLSKFAARTNFDTYIAAGAWTKVQFNTADSNDQGAFQADANRFVAPERGLYRFAATLAFKRNGSNAPSAFEGQFYRNGAPAGRGRGAATGSLVDGVTCIAVDTMLRLDPGDAIAVFARLTGGDGYAASTDALFAGYQIA